MVDLGGGRTVRVKRPSVTLQTNRPGVVQSIWMKQGPPGTPGRSVSSVARTSGTGAPGTLDTYTITYSDSTMTTFQIYNGANGSNGTNGTNGRGITSIARTSGTGAAGTTDTYTITFTDATTSTFSVVNGANGTNGTNGTNGRGVSTIARTSGTGAAGTTDTYTITYTDATTSTFTVVNGANGTNGSTGAAGRGVASIARTSGTGAPGTTDTYTITYSDATTSTFTVTNGANGAGSGDVSGPASATVNNLATYNATNGKLLKDSGVPISDVTANTTARHSHSNKAVLDATTASFTTADESKLDGIAAGATANRSDAATDTLLADKMAKSANLSDVANTTTARTNLGLGTAATKNTGTGAGQVPVLSGTPGTPDGSKFLRDDGTWAAGGGGGGALLAQKVHAPSTDPSYTTTSATPVDVDATNAVVTFTAPSSGTVRYQIAGNAYSSSVSSAVMLCLRSGATNIAGSERTAGADINPYPFFYTFTESGLTPGVSYTRKLGFRTTFSGTAGIKARVSSEFSGNTTGYPLVIEVFSA